MSETSDVVEVHGPEVIDIDDIEDEAEEPSVHGARGNLRVEEPPLSHCVIIDDDDGVEVVVASKRKACAMSAQCSKRAHLQIPDGDEAMHMDACGCKVPFLKTRGDWLAAIDAKNGEAVRRAQLPLLLQLVKFTCPSCLSPVSCRDVANLLGPTGGEQAMKDLSCACMDALQDRSWMSHCPLTLPAAIQALMESPASSLSSGVWSPQMWQLRSLSLTELRAVMRRLGIQAEGQFEECADRLLANARGRALVSEAVKSVAMMALLYRGRLISHDQLPSSHFCSPSDAPSASGSAVMDAAKSQRRYRTKAVMPGTSVPSGVGPSKPSSQLASHPLQFDDYFAVNPPAELYSIAPPPLSAAVATPSKAPQLQGHQGLNAASQTVRRSPRHAAQAEGFLAPGSSSSGTQLYPMPFSTPPPAHSLAVGLMPMAPMPFSNGDYELAQQFLSGHVSSVFGAKPAGFPGMPFPPPNHPATGFLPGPGYGGGRYRSVKASNGTGYAGDSHQEMARAVPHMEAAKCRREQLQKELKMTMVAIKFLLQHCVHQGALKSEMIGTSAVVLEGGLPALLRSTLINDSLVDMALHTSLYQDVLGIVKMCAASQTLLPALISPADWPTVAECPVESAAARAPGPSRRAQPPQQGGGPAASLRSGNAPSNGPAAEAKSGSVQDQLEQLQQLCQLYKRMLSQGVVDEESDINVLALVLEITETEAAVKEAVQTWSLMRQREEAKDSSRNGASGAGSSRLPAPVLSVEQERHILEEKLGKLRLITCKLKHEHAYASMAQGMAEGNKKRMRAIMQEVSSLATCLPVTWESSVHVAVDEDRIDLLRVLILPGQDTPYANGVFVFDAFLPANYPESHPMVKFLTTGAGTVRFNPNLYNCGKVCLSLLGTWSGPSWQPGVSTFLQVLVSLQAMVFCQKPYFNEPGYQSSEGTANGNRASDQYNAGVRHNNVRFGILAPLQKPNGKPHSVFSEVLALHWRHKRQIIKDQLRAWKSPSAGEVARLLDALPAQ